MPLPIGSITFEIMRARRNSRSKGDSLDDIVDRLAASYSDCDEDRPDSIIACYPNSQNIIEALKTLIDMLFPGKLSHKPVHHRNLPAFLRARAVRALRLLRPEIERAIPFRWKGEAAKHEGAPKPVPVKAEARRVLARFAERLPEIRTYLIEDVRAAYEGDPAALTYAEVQLAYPGVLAIASHRIAHELYKLDVPIVPRVMSEWTHSVTGVDIHPGAQIGHGFFIDHATGVVIGETCVIGNNVKIYQGVTLGARSFPLDERGFPIKHIKRHPTVEDGVVIYANATILGGNTVIGRGSTIGGNVFLTESVPSNTVVSANHPELRIKSSATPSADDWVI
ncbi:MAG: serine O-acetyltransferase [Kiritimatiellae bacterium]|nr:serine O-acetyltransferase [Kiritimatiellia bacterium]MDW8458520.1 serine O-acetyltransferase EpsC [Verrucomicrobiota bacterium]